MAGKLLTALRERIQEMDLKPVTQSKTTGTIAATSGGAAGLLYLIRAVKPELLPWGESEDVAIVAAATTIFSRAVTWIRKWKS